MLFRIVQIRDGLMNNNRGLRTKAEDALWEAADLRFRRGHPRPSESEMAKNIETAVKRQKQLMVAWERAQVQENQKKKQFLC